MGLGEGDDLLGAALAGDSSAADRLIEQQRPWVRRYIHSRVRTPDDGDDLVQEVLVHAFRALPSFRQQCPFSQWVLQIAVNALRNYYARDLPRSAAQSSYEDLAETEPLKLQRNAAPLCPERVVEQKTFVEQLLAAAREACSPEERIVLFLRWQEETSEQIALLLNMKSVTVRTHYLRGKARLLAYLVQHCPDLLGGRGAITAALEKARASSDPGERPTPVEEAAFQNPRQSSAAFRSVCVKLARYLSIMIVLLVEGILGGD